MKVNVSVTKTLRPGMPSAKAYSLFFTDEAAYFIFLGRDWRGFGMKSSNNFLADILAGAFLAVAGAKSDIALKAKLHEIEGKDLDAMVAEDKNSLKIPYNEIISMKSKKQSFWASHAHVLFRTRKHGKFIFTFEDDEPREQIVAYLGQKGLAGEKKSVSTKNKLFLKSFIFLLLLGVATIIVFALMPQRQEFDKLSIGSESNANAEEVLPRNWVNDYSNLLEDFEEDVLNDKITQFEKETTIEIGVLLLPTIKPQFDDHKAFAATTFNRWGIGKKYKNNGIFFTAATQDKHVRITVGRGMEKVFTDEICGKILDEAVMPHLKGGDYFKVTSGLLDETIRISRKNLKTLQTEWTARIETRE